MGGRSGEERGEYASLASGGADAPESKAFIYSTQSCSTMLWLTPVWFDGAAPCPRSVGDW